MTKNNSMFLSKKIKLVKWISVIAIVCGIFSLIWNSKERKSDPLDGVNPSISARRSAGHSRSTRPDSVAESETQFSQMSRSERSESLGIRLDALRSYDDPETLEKHITSLIRDIDSLNPFERLGYTEAIENSLAMLDGDGQEKLVWIAKNLSTFERAFGQRKTAFGSSVSQMFSLLTSNLRDGDINIRKALEEIPNEESRYDVTTRMVPHLFLVSRDQQLEILDSLPNDYKMLAEQGMIEIAASQDALQVEAVDLYLSGGGIDDGGRALVKLFKKPEWFWENAESVEKMLNSTVDGHRRDLVISEMVKLISTHSEKEAENWISEISDPVLQSKTLKELKSN